MSGTKHFKSHTSVRRFDMESIGRVHRHEQNKAEQSMGTWTLTIRRYEGTPHVISSRNNMTTAIVLHLTCEILLWPLAVPIDLKEDCDIGMKDIFRNSKPSIDNQVIQLMTPFLSS